MNIILEDVKSSVGIPEDVDDYNLDILMHINSVFLILFQIGVTEELISVDDEDTWDDVITNGLQDHVKSYVCGRVRLLFDPPQQSSVAESLKRNIDELEWRLKIASES